jgi:ribonucleoside-diphosphate reductase alpha chain
MNAASQSAMVAEPRLSANALVVLRARYLRKNESGEIIETPAEMFRRVAAHVAHAEWPSTTPS